MKPTNINEKKKKKMLEMLQQKTSKFHLRLTVFEFHFGF